MILWIHQGSSWWVSLGVLWHIYVVFGFPKSYCSIFYLTLPERTGMFGSTWKHKLQALF